jgi:hypothetical protein
MDSMESICYSMKSISPTYGKVKNYVPWNPSDILWIPPYIPWIPYGITWGG